MPKERTKEEGVPLTTRLKRMLPGQRRDARLPMPAGGRRDPRLPPESTGEAIQSGFDAVRTLTKPIRARVAPRRTDRRA